MTNKKPTPKKTAKKAVAKKPAVKKASAIKSDLVGGHSHSDMKFVPNPPAALSEPSKVAVSGHMTNLKKKKKFLSWFRR